MDNKKYLEQEKFILDNAPKFKNGNGNIKWASLALRFAKEFPDVSAHPERIRSMYRKFKDNKYQMHVVNGRAIEKVKREKKPLSEVLIKSLKKKWSITYLAEKLNVSTDDILAEIMQLQFSGYSISTWQEDGEKFVQFDLRNRHASEPKKYNLNFQGDEIKIALFSDTHIGHKQSRKTEVNQFLEYAYDQGVREAFFVGDLVEGHYMSIRPTSIKELEAIGFDDQLDLADKTIPHLDGLVYHMISGNHDGTFTRNAFANPIKQLSKRRDDVIYHGHNFAKINITDEVDISLVHPTDGIGQNYGLKMKQHIERAHKSKLSRFIFMGHYHKFDHTHYDGIDGWIMPSFVGRSHFMDDKNLDSIVGGIILTLKFNYDGELISFSPEYIFFDE